MIKQIQVEVENEFLTQEDDSVELTSSVFERVFRKLASEKSSIGKIFPVYLKINNIYYTLGVYSLNNLGSTSLFLELPKGTFFDHITFGNSLARLNAHLTKITNNQRGKVAPIKPIHLSNGTYLVLTLIVKDINLLKKAPKKVIYPPIDIEQAKLLKEALITDGNFNGSGIIDVGNSPGSVVIQLFLIPKKVNFKVLNFAKSGLGDLAEKFDIEILKAIPIQIAHLEHKFQNEYQFGLLAFRYPAEIDGPLYLHFPVDNSGLYFNSNDQNLNESVLQINNASHVASS